MNCELCKMRMSDAAMDSLTLPERAEFARHIQACGSCRTEFGRVQALLQTIDSSVMAQAAAEPSPDFIRQVRIRIAAESAPVHSRWGWWAPAAACGTVVIIATAIWLVWARGAGQRSVATTVPANPLPKIATPAAPSPARTSPVAIAPKEISGVLLIHRVKALQRPRMDHEPEVIVPPGEAEGVLQFAAALQSGKLDGVKLIADLKNADQPIEIKPLVIVPLEASEQTDDNGSGPGGSDGREDFVNEAQTEAIAP